MSTPIYLKDGRRIGYVEGDTFTKYIDNRGILLTPNALAYEMYLLPQLEALGVKHLVVVNEESGITYEMDFDQFMDDDPVRMWKGRGGYPPQFAQLLTKWKQTKNE